MTQEHVDQATLLAFGIAGMPYTGSGCLSILINNGFKYEESYLLKRSTMKNFEKILQRGIVSGNFLINTPGHAMAFVDGHLIDTERKGFDNRVIEHIWRVTK